MSDLTITVVSMSQYVWIIGMGCGGTLFNSRGVVTSPNYPQPHNQASNCEWILKVPPGQKIQLKFTSKQTVFWFVSFKNEYKYQRQIKAKFNGRIRIELYRI